MTVDRLSNLAAKRAEEKRPEWAEEGRVLATPAWATTSLVYVEVVSQPGVRHGPFYWTGNGKMWQAGDWCMVITSNTGARLAHIWCTGAPIGVDIGEIDF